MRHVPRTTASALLLGAFLITVTSLVSNISLVDISKLPNTSSLQQPSPPTTFLSSQSPSTTFSPGSVILLAIVLVSLLAAFVMARRRGPANPYAFWRLVGLLVGMAIIYEITQILLSVQSNGINTLQEQQAELAVAAISLAVVLVAGLVVITVAIRDRSTAVHLTAVIEEAGSTRAIRQTLKSIRSRIYSMPEPEVYRDAVITCYSAMTKFLSRQGAEDRPSFTPQELEANATGKVGSIETEVHALTRLFEKARYASSPVTMRDAQDSADALERMTSRESAGSR